MMLEIVAKCGNETFKKWSYFRLEFYKKYGGFCTGKILTVENLVESVEFHPKSGRKCLIFEHFQRSFQHVEKNGPFYKVYMDSNVENFCRKKYTDKMTRAQPAAGRDKIQWKKRGILWQRRGGYVILYYDNLSNFVTGETKGPVPFR